MEKQYEILVLGSDEKVKKQIKSQLENIDALNFDVHLHAVKTEEELFETVTSSEPNLIISEYDLPSFSGMEALQIVKDEYPDLPFIFFSNTSEDDQIVSSIVEGASDFIPKKRPARLGPAVVRELKSAEKHKKVLKLHRKSKSKYERLIQSLNSIIWEANPETFQFSYISPKVEQILGYTTQEWCTYSFWEDHIHPDDRQMTVNKCQTETQRGNDHILEYRLIDADNNIVWIKDIISVITQNGKPISLRGLMIDVTEQKIAEQERDNANLQLKERIKEQKCLYEISRLDELNLTVPQLLQKTVDLIPRGFQFPDQCEAQISFKDIKFETDNFVNAKWKLAETSSAGYSNELQITAAYPMTIPGEAGPSFLEAEHNLLKSIANQLVLKIDRINSRKKLRKRQFLVDRAYQIAKIGSWELDLTDKSLYWSEETRRIHEVPYSYQPNSDTVLDFCKTDQDREKLRMAMKRLITVGEPFDIEFKIFTEQGNDCWVRAIGESEFQNGQCIRAYRSIQDIDNHKRTQETLLYNEQRFKSMVQDGADLIAIVLRDGTYKYVSPSYRNILHLNPGKLLNIKAYDLVHLDDLGKIRRTIENLDQNDRAKVTPYRFRNGDGSWSWLESTITNLTENPAVRGFIVNSRDITEQIDREETLLEIVERYNYVTQASNDTIYDWDVVNDILLWDQNFSKLYKTDVNGRDATINDLYEYVHPDDMDQLRKEIDDVLASNETTWEGEYRLEKVDGRYAHIFERGFILRDKNNNATRMIGSLLDMTDRIEHQKNLESTKQKLKDVVEHSVNMFYKHDVDHNLTYVSPQSEQYLGLTPKEAKIKWTETVTDNPINIEGLKHTQRAIDTGETQPPFELELNKADGEKIKVRVSEAPIVENGETVAIVGSLTDITEQNRYENMLRESLKEKETLLMEIHHRVKNNMAAVSGMMQLQALEEEDINFQKKLYDSVSRIKTMAIVHELLYQSKSFSSLDFSENLKKLVSVVTDTLNEETTLNLEFNCENLTLNVNQAIPCSLIVNEIITNTLKHAFNGVDEGTIRIDLSEQNDRLKLVIRDDGSGLDEAVDSGNIDNSSSLGIHLIDTLSRQLEGSYEYKPIESGTLFQLEFDMNEVKGTGNAHL